MKVRDEGEDPRKDSLIGAGAEYLGHGMTFALSTLLFFLAGDWLDGKFGTEPGLALVGLFVGASAGFWNLYSRVTHMRDSAGADDSEGDSRT